MSEAAFTISIVRLSEDKAGNSYFADESLPTTAQDFAPPAPPLYVGAPWATKRSLLLLVPEGWYGDLHPAPSRQLMTMVRGTVEVTTSTGEIRRFGPGTVLLAEDVRGKGHATRSVDGQAVVIVAQLDDRT